MHCTSKKNTEKSYNAWSSHWSKSIVHKRVHSSRLAEFLSAYLGVTKFISGSNCKSSEWMLVQLNCAIWNCNKSGNKQSCGIRKGNSNILII